MDILFITLGAFCVLIGIAGSIIPMLPGTPISYVGMLLLLLVDGCTYTATYLLTMLGMVILQPAFNYYIPIWGVKKYGGSAYGQWGGVLGLIIGLFFAPWGIFLGPFVGAVVGELIAGKSTEDSLKAGFGSFVGNMLTIVFGLILSGVMAYSFFAEVFRIYCN